MFKRNLQCQISVLRLLCREPPASAGFYADLLGRPSSRLADLCDAAAKGRRDAWTVVAQDRGAGPPMRRRAPPKSSSRRKCGRGRGNLHHWKKPAEHTARPVQMDFGTTFVASDPEAIACACSFRRSVNCNSAALRVPKRRTPWLRTNLPIAAPRASFSRSARPANKFAGRVIAAGRCGSRNRHAGQSPSIDIPSSNHVVGLDLTRRNRCGQAPW